MTIGKKHRPRDPRDKVLPRTRVKKAMNRARRRRQRVVFTNGVFDLLHPGHVDLLQRARSLGDVLVVGINTDASVRRLKGPERPFMRARERALMLAALESVDHVVMFSEDTPARLIAEVGPDVLVKGGDWKADDIVGSEEVISRGGRVVRLSLVKGLSTTRIARRVRTP
jgi:rfaE bifunctional protein nucleotidyltransferase chain/domain